MKDITRSNTDDLFSAFFGNWLTSPDKNIYGNLQIDMYDEGDSLVISASAPGVPKESIRATYIRSNNSIKISVEDSYERKENKPNFYVRERKVASSERTIRLPYKIQETSFTSEHKDGVMTLKFIKSEKQDSDEIDVSPK